MTILGDPKLERLLDRLHERSDAQRSAIRAHYDPARLFQTMTLPFSGGLEMPLRLG